jgi:AcrR family transcriptional regulator
MKTMAMSIQGQCELADTSSGPIPEHARTLSIVPEVASRAERKERTRQSLLEGTLTLLENRSLASLSLREVTRAVGIVPTAFYRHFDSMDDLGVALVENSTRSLRQLIREARRNPSDDPIAGSVGILVRQVHADEPEFRFVIRERFGGVTAVTRAIAAELRLFTSELTIDLARMPALRDWTAEDLEMAADLMVNAMLGIVQALLEVDRQHLEDEQAVIAKAERQLRLIALGMAGWRGTLQS